MKNDPMISVEQKLLLNLCGIEFSKEGIETIRELISKISDWSYFTHLANEHGIAALVWHNLDSNGLSSGMPEDAKSFLKCTLMRNLGRNTFYAETMGEVLNLLNKSGIKTVILKGLALENSVYGNTGLRQMSDVDILIKRDECFRARKILMNNGFESLPVKSIFHSVIIEYAGKHLPSLQKKGAMVEIHHELFGGKKNSLTQKLFESSYEVRIKDEAAWFPSPRLFFLYLVKHLSQHEMNNESQLRLYIDLLVLIRKHRDEILNETLVSDANEGGMIEILSRRLEILHEVWGISFPGFLTELIKKHHDEEFMKLFLFFLGSPKGNPQGDKAAYYRTVVREIPGFHRRVMYVLGDLFPSFEFMKNRYNCSSSLKVLIYYPHRFGKLAWLFGR